MDVIRRRLPKDIYNRHVTFLYGTVAEINRVLTRECPDASPLAPSCRGHWRAYLRGDYEADYICIVGVARPSDKTRDERMAFLAHESLHHVGHVLRMAGIELTEATEEAYTYYMTFTIERCARLMP